MKVLGLVKQNNAWRYAIVDEGRKLLIKGALQGSDFDKSLQDLINNLHKQKIDFATVTLLAIPAYIIDSDMPTPSKDELGKIKKVFKGIADNIQEINPKLAELYSIWIEESGHRQIKNLQSQETEQDEEVLFPIIIWYDDLHKSQIILANNFNNYSVLSEHKSASIYELISRFEKILKKEDFFKLASMGNEAFQYFTRVDQNTEQEFDLYYLEAELLKSIEKYESTAYLDISNDLKEELYQDFCYDVCASLQEALIDSIISKMVNFAYELGVTTLAVTGDFAQNPRFIKVFSKHAEELEFQLKFANHLILEDLATWIAGLAFQAEKFKINCK